MTRLQDARPLKLFDQDEVAELLGFSPRTLEGWRHRGIGPPSTKIGGRVRYRADRLRQWIEDQTDDRPAGTRPDR